jgi:hypothetical protein
MHTVTEIGYSGTEFISPESNTCGRDTWNAIECDIKEDGAAESSEMRDPAHV